MKKTLKFIIAIHIHQPVGNFDFVLEKAFTDSYLPFFRVLEKHPNIKLSLHVTGILNEWIENHFPEWLDLIRKMVDRGQIQILSGGYYEPILSVIPPEDRFGQIEKQNDYIEKTYNTKARGMWLAERVWEPTLPTCMTKAGMEFTVIDDVHFKYAGLQDDQLFNYYITEDLGNKINLFPISQELRYLIPFQEVDKTISYLKSLATDDGNRIIVFADDGEKFGLWPNTHDHVYKEGWLDKFFSSLSKNSNWIQLYHFSEILDDMKPAGNIYLPTASYAEMLHWALPKTAFKAYEEFEYTLKENELFDKFGVFVRGGFWRNFFSKYEESNNLHKKMMRVSEKIQSNIARLSKKKRTETENYLWAGQCNCSYWHGVFGGLYLPHLRTAIYENLIKAENIVDGASNQSSNIEIVDFTKNGTDEILVETPKQNIYISLLDGGTIFEHDLKESAFNIHDTMARREEGYHKKLLEFAASKVKDKSDDLASIHDLIVVKEEGLEKKLFYDNYLPRSLRLQLYPVDVTLDEIYSARKFDICDLSSVEYELVSKKITDDEIILKLFANAVVTNGGEVSKIAIEKKIFFPQSSFGYRAEINIKKIAGSDMELSLGVDFFFSMLGGDSKDRYYYSESSDLGKPPLNSKQILANEQSISLIDEWKKLKITLDVNKDVDFFLYPIESINLSESGFEKVYQASAVVAIAKINICSDNKSIIIEERIENF